MPAGFLITADDFGITPRISAGMMQLAQKGKIHRLSLMTNMPGTEEAIRLAAVNPQVIYGLHFNLTEQNSLTGVLSGVTDPETGFYSRSKLLKSVLIGKIKSVQVRQELEAQYYRAVQSGVNIQYMDSHQHVHVFPGIYEVCINFAREKGIKIRIPNPSRFSPHRWKQFFSMKFFLSFQQVPEELKSNTTISSVFDLKKDFPEYSDYASLIPAASTGGIHELMTHPYVRDESLKSLYPEEKYTFKKKFLEKAFWEWELLSRGEILNRL